MAQQHDLFDDIIDISKGLSALKNPLGGVTDALMGTATGEAPHWNPADYKERPRANSIPCLVCNYEKSSCTRCMEVCPVDAIDIEEYCIDIADTCRKCGLCVAACPTEAFNSPKLKPKKLYDDIARAAVAHTHAYVTCTRALRRLPRDNEVVVACIGDITPETWLSVLVDFPNVSVYLPLGICDNCKTVSGEDALGEAIATAEEWAGCGMDLEVDPKQLKCEKRREYERKEFMDNVVRKTGLAVSKLTPATAALATVTQRLKDHTNKLKAIESTLSTACGTIRSSPATSRCPRPSAISRSAPRAANACACAPRTRATCSGPVASPSSPPTASAAACAPRPARTTRSRWNPMMRPTWWSPTRTPSRSARMPSAPAPRRRRPR